MKRRWIRWTLAVVAIAVLGWALLPVHAGAKEKQVSFLDLSDFTGPVAGLALPNSNGIEDYLKKTLMRREGSKGSKSITSA